jgi:hypothetical protein
MLSAFSFCQKRTIQKSFVWQHFKIFTCKKINTSTQNVVKEELRVYCQHSNCNANYKYRVGGTTRNMSTHLKKHNIFGKDEEEKVDQTDQQKPATSEQYARILYCIVMFIITAGLSFRAVQNRFFKMLITEFSHVSFPWPGRKKIRKVAHILAKEKEENIKKKLEAAKSVSITADGWTSKFQKLSKCYQNRIKFWVLNILTINYFSGYLGVTAHYFVKFKIKSVYLGLLHITGRHIHENLAAHLRGIFSKFNISSKVVSITG